MEGVNSETNNHGPMDNATLYKLSNSLQRTDVKEVLEEFSHLFKWRPDGGDTLLDVGCGTGDVLNDILMPFLPENMGNIIGADVSAHMINDAKKTYTNPKMSFRLMDANKDVEEQDILSCAPFDHITSFYCLMFIQDQKTAMQNFYKLLRPDGDMLLVFLANHPAYKFYAQQAKDEKWSTYMNGVVEKITTPYQYSSSPADDLHKILVDVGFKDVNVVVRTKAYTFKGIQSLRNTFEAVNSFVSRMPEHKRSEYIDDLVERLAQDSAIDDYKTCPETCRFAPVYGLMIAHARK